MYRFYLDIFGNQLKEINPKFGKVSISETRESDQFFSRKKFPKIKLIGDDFDTVANGSVYYEFTIRWQEWIDGEYQEILQGTFTKLDCDIDEDLRVLEVEPKISDRYKDLMDSLDVELDFLKYNIGTVNVEYSRKPILQIYTLGSNKITNYLENRFWEQECEPIYDHASLWQTYNFGKVDVMKGMIVGIGDGVSPDVTGEITDEFIDIDGFGSGNSVFTTNAGRYQVVSYGIPFNSTSGFSGSDLDSYEGSLAFTIPSGTLTDDDFNSVWRDQASPSNQCTFMGVDPNTGEYCFRNHSGNSFPTGGTLEHVSGATNTANQVWTGDPDTSGKFRWVIYDTNIGVQDYIFLGGVNESLSNTPSYLGGTIFNSTTTSDQVRIITYNVYARLLCNSLLVNYESGAVPLLAAALPLPSADIISKTDNYLYAAPVNLASDQVEISDEHSTTEGLWGVFSEDALHFSGEYFVRPSDANELLPVCNSIWTEASLWFHHSEITNTMQSLNDETITLRHGYKLSNVIEKVLGKIAPTLSHGGSSAFSDFLYGSSNPIRGNRELIITPITNVMNSNYDTPASKSKIKFSDILTLLRNIYNAYMDVDVDNSLIIEHVSYFMNGRTYTNTNSSADTTGIINPRTGKGITSLMNSYSYESQEIPEYIDIQYGSETTPDFDGGYIECLNNFVQKGLIEARNAGKFIADLVFILLQPHELSKDSFAIMEATLTNGKYVVDEPTVTIDGIAKVIQNGYLSIPYLQENYHIYNLPTFDVLFNGTTHDVKVDGGSVKRTKIQEIELPSDLFIDTQRLITTEIGSGLVVSKEFKTDGGSQKIKIEHDTEL